MISSSIWHCDYCLGDICCCIKSNLPFLSSIVTMPELFSFFSKEVEMISRNTPAQPSFWLRSTGTHPMVVFALCRALGWQIAHFHSRGTALSLSQCICMHRMWPFPVLQWGCQPFPLSLWHLVTGMAGAASSWVPSEQKVSLSSVQVKRHFSGWLHQRAGGALGSPSKGWWSEVLLSVLGESSTQHLAETQPRNWKQQQRGKERETRKIKEKKKNTGKKL